MHLIPWTDLNSMNHAEVLRDHIEGVTVTEDNISENMAWRANRTQHEIRKAMKQANDRGAPLVAAIMRIPKMN